MFTGANTSSLLIELNTLITWYFHHKPPPYPSTEGLARSHSAAAWRSALRATGHDKGLAAQPTIPASPSHPDTVTMAAQPAKEGENSGPAEPGAGARPGEGTSYSYLCTRVGIGLSAASNWIVESGRPASLA